MSYLTFYSGQSLLVMFLELVFWVNYCAVHHTGQRLNEPLIVFGDIAVATDLEITDPCTALGCKWQRSKNGKVLLPYVFSDKYCEWKLLPKTPNSLRGEGYYFTRLEIFWEIDLTQNRGTLATYCLIQGKNPIFIFIYNRVRAVAYA